jgi:hypothetical protein
LHSSRAIEVGSFGLDYKTDTVIQTSLRNELKSDVTVITVAHRLQTILDSDKIVSSLKGSPKASLTCCAIDGPRRRPYRRCSFVPVKLVTDLKQVDYDSPKALLQNPKGKLRALVDESGEKEKLYAMAEGKSNRK